MSAFKTDGALTTAQEQGGARKSFPFEGDVASFIVEQDYLVLLASYSPVAISTAHGTFTNAFLVRESALENIGAGVVKFTRTYAQIPATRNEYGTFAFQYPGLYGTLTPPYAFQYWTVADDGRDPYLDVGSSRMKHEYFLCAAGQTYATPDLIPILPKLAFNIIGNESSRNAYLLKEGVFWSDTNPTVEAWLDLVAGGSGIGEGAEDGEFIAEDSTIERWMGDIYVRVTRYLKAK
jgi:hypothetical protein